jgi:hypothetical protein
MILTILPKNWIYEVMNILVLDDKHVLYDPK